MRIDIIERKEEILEWIKLNQSKSFISKKLNCKQDTLNSYLKNMNIFYKGNQSGNGIKTDGKKMSAIEYSKTHGCKGASLKKKLIDEGYFVDICSDCGNKGEWNGKPIILELDHINGNHYDNRFENLRILCPNCHSQTPTFRGRGSGNKNKVNNTCVDCGCNILKSSKRCQNCSKKNEKGLMKKCVCGKEIKKIRQTCIECKYKNSRKTERPTFEILQKEIVDFGYSGTGRKYGVSDKTIKKWIKTYENK